MKNFSTVVAPLNEVVKKSLNFKCGEARKREVIVHLRIDSLMHSDLHCLIFLNLLILNVMHQCGYWGCFTSSGSSYCTYFTEKLYSVVLNYSTYKSYWHLATLSFAGVICNS